MKMMEAQSGGNTAGLSMTSKVIQFNPNHEIVKSLNEMIQKDAENPLIEAIIQQLHANARIIDGDIPDFNTMIANSEKIIAKSLKS